MAYDPHMSIMGRSVDCALNRGHVGYCDSRRTNTLACTRMLSGAHRPVLRAGEDWRWCYIDEALVCEIPAHERWGPAPIRLSEHRITAVRAVGEARPTTTETCCSTSAGGPPNSSRFSPAPSVVEAYGSQDNGDRDSRSGRVLGEIGLLTRRRADARLDRLDEDGACQPRASNHAADGHERTPAGGFSSPVTRAARRWPAPRRVRRR